MQSVDQSETPQVGLSKDSQPATAKVVDVTENENKMASIIIGISILVYYFMTAVFGTIYFMSPSFLFMICWTKMFQWWNGFMYSWWTAFMTVMNR